ncbi:sugar ABC transporter ATP-binding protein [Aureimonas frigidaquae]|uniref:ABC transporter-like protein n=1 Tax=Aureimonas frigidaquae TaxID=424757 RepID=A0A0P0Z2C4_9HYPH|nr:sugar ABC transporter ATP-binding protein [Aureimonas frigidaquae]BAT28170.1 ABC transporter-like protein [Aureimonas frigidaquae]
MQIADKASVPAHGDTILSIENVSKSYGPVNALRNVSLTIRRGTIHGLLGENGAGKSTLVGIISGQRTATSGRVSMDGVEVHGADVKAMEKAGVFLVTQEPMIIDNMSAAENLMLGIWPERSGFVDWKRMRAEAARMLEGSGIAADAIAGRLDAVARRKLNILRAMYSGGRVIILDEPTAALTVADRDILFDFMRRLKREGVTFVFISHYNDEILDICDAVSVLRDGALAGGSEDLSQLTSAGLSELVLGRGLDLFQRQRTAPPATEPIVVRNVAGKGLALESLSIRPGEIVGFTGLPGSGAKELARAIFGFLPGVSGTIRFGTQGETPLPRSPRDAFNTGIAYLSDDRRRDGSVGQLPIGQNIAMSSLERRSRGGFIDARAEGGVIDRFFKAMGIKAPSPDYAVDTLSGGNQQKVCLGRVLATEPRLLIVDEPTRGIDVGVKQDVLRILDELSRKGVAIIIVSTDSDELARAADRVCIFGGGKVVHVVEGTDITSDTLRRLAQM